MSTSQATCPVCGTLLSKPGDPCARCVFAGILSSPSDAETVVADQGDALPLPVQTLVIDDKYIIVKEVGRGGMGVVYQARQENLNRVVAVKMMVGGVHASEEGKQRFLKEAKAAARLNHPNIVAIHDWGEDGGLPYFSMDYIEGKTLAQISRDKPLPHHAVAEIICALARAMHYAHTQGVLHRDLKPSNVLVDAEGVPRLTDFGLAREMGEGTQLTGTGQFLGTPGFLPPEQASAKSGIIGPASDVYGLGAILYFLLTGRAPFVAETFEEMLQQLYHADPISPRLLNASVPPDLETICLKCLEKEPAQRYISAQELVDDLGRFQRHEPIRARPAGALDKTRKWILRHPVTAALSAALVVAILVGLAATTWQWRVAEGQRAQVVAENVRLQLQRGEELFDRGNSALALATLARSLREHPTSRAISERILNTLLHRGFVWPASADPTQSAAQLPRKETTGLQTQFRLARSADGHLLATATNGESIQLWELPANRLRREIVLPGRTVLRSIALDRQGSRVLASCSDHFARVWKLNEEAAPLQLSHPEPVHCAEFSPDGLLILTASRDGIARLWDAATGRMVRESRKLASSLNAARFNSDGRLVAIAGDEGAVQVLVGTTLEPLTESRPLSLPAEDVRFTESGTALIVITSHAAQEWFRWTTAIAPGQTKVPAVSAEPELKPVTRILGRDATNFHTLDVVAVQLSPDQTMLATASADRTARLWDARTCRPLCAPLQHAETVNAVAWSPDGLRLATSAANGHIRLWDAGTGMPLSDVLDAGELTWGVWFAEDGRRILTTNGRSWPIQTMPGKIPSWLSRMAEVAAGVHLSEQHVIQWHSAKESSELQRELMAEDRARELAGWARGLLRLP
jgi:predicted Ser/Thr protein kinase/type II secretory pathway pseudopilin PulG